MATTHRDQRRRIATNTVHHSAATPSFVELPVLQAV